MADGSSQRNHLEDRHFRVVAGEPLLPRMVDQFKPHGEVVIVNGVEGDENNDPRYDIPGSTRAFAKRNSFKYGAADMIAKGLQQWSAGGITILFGDVRFTNRCVSTMVEQSKKLNREAGDWQVFGRSKSNHLTGKRWGEYFAVSFYDEPAATEAWISLEFLNHVKNSSDPQYPRDVRIGAWEWYFTNENMSWEQCGQREVNPGPHFTEITDWTDDFDFEGDIKMWEKVFNLTIGAKDE